MITIKTTKYQLISRKKELFLEIHFSSESKEGMLSSNVTINVSYLSAILAKSSETVCGLFYFASLVYAIDRTFKRGIHSVDSWSRQFDVEFKLPANELFSINRIETEKILSFLTEIIGHVLLLRLMVLCIKRVKYQRLTMKYLKLICFLVD